MKKRILSTLLTLTLCLGLLPAALAAGNSYGPDEEGWGYVTSEKVIALGEISYDGTEQVKCGSFTITIENTGTQTLTSRAFHSSGNGLLYFVPAISIQPGESRDVTVQYTVPEGRDYGEYEDYLYIEFEGLVSAGKPVEDIIQFLPQFTLVEASSGSGNYDDNVFVDSMGNQYYGVDGLGGSSSSFSSGTSGDAGTLSPSAAKSQYGISVSPSHVEFDPCFVGDKVEPIIITITNNGSHTVDVGYRGGFESDDSMVSISANHSHTDDMAPGESREYKVTLKTRNAASSTANVEA